MVAVDFISFVTPHLKPLGEAVPALLVIVEDIDKAFSLTNVTSFILVLLFYRIICSIIFGRTFGQFLTGISLSGSFVMKRALAPIRELLGICLFPLIIFDLPAVVSKRTLKEILTGVRCVISGKLKAILSICFITPALLVLAFYAPLLKGFELKQNVPIESSIGKIKKKEMSNQITFSEFGFSIDQTEGRILLPTAAIKINKNKKTLGPGVLVYDDKIKGFVEIRKVKTFSFHRILKDFVKENFLSPYTYPHIFKFVTDASNQNKNFIRSKSEDDKLLAEVYKLLITSFNLKLSNLLEFTLENGPITKSFIHVREKFESIFTGKAKKINLGAIGDKVSIYSELKAGGLKYYELIPINLNQGELFYISNDLRSRKYLPVARGLSWSVDGKRGFSATRDFLEESFGKNTENKELNQLIYESYFEVGKLVLSRANAVDKELLISHVKKVLNILEEKPELNKKLFSKLNRIITGPEIQGSRFFWRDRSSVMGDFLWALFYGLIQGVTEFLPVSSSGHLALIPYFFKLKDPGVVFDLLMHFGTAIAVILYFRIEVGRLIREGVDFFLKRDFKNTVFFQNFSLATGFSFILILVLKSVALSHGRDPLLIGINFIVFGLLMYLSDRSKSKGVDLTNMPKFKKAIIIGLSQSLAIFPGVSRSGATLTASRFLGMGRVEASRFSFLLSLPVILGSIVFKIPDILAGTAIGASMTMMVVGVISSFVFGILTIHIFLRLIASIGLVYFSIYRVIIGGILMYLSFVAN